MPVPNLKFLSELGPCISKTKDKRKENKRSKQVLVLRISFFAKNFFFLITLTAKLHVVVASPAAFLATTVYVPASLGNASVIVSKCLLPSTKVYRKYCSNFNF